MSTLCLARASVSYGRSFGSRLTLTVVDAAAQPPASAGRRGRRPRRRCRDRRSAAGRQVLVTGSAAETSTDRDGRFRLSAVPAGDRTVVVTYLGRQDAIVEAKVVAGATQRLDIQMKMVAVRGDRQRAWDS